VLATAAFVLLGDRPVAVNPPEAGGGSGGRVRGSHVRAGTANRRRCGPPGGDASSALTAAWGATPVVLRCGVGRPGALTATSQLTTVDGVDWLPERLQHGVRFTAIGRVAYVEVTVPDRLRAGGRYADRPGGGRRARAGRGATGLRHRAARSVSAGPDASAGPTARAGLTSSG